MIFRDKQDCTVQFFYSFCFNVSGGHFMLQSLVVLVLIVIISFIVKMKNE